MRRSLHRARYERGQGMASVGWKEILIIVVVIIVVLFVIRMRERT